jgi:hypothetical protein
MLDKVGSHIVIGFRKAGADYENYQNITTPVSVAFQDVYVRIRTYGSTFKVFVNNAYINREYGGVLAGTYVNPWRTFFRTTGTGTATVKGFNILADSYVGVTGVVSTTTKRKVFGLVGASGL